MVGNVILEPLFFSSLPSEHSRLTESRHAGNSVLQKCKSDTAVLFKYTRAHTRTHPDTPWKLSRT